MKAVFAAFSKCALRTALDDNDGNETGQGIERVIEVVGACEFASFLLVRQKDVDTF